MSETQETYSKLIEICRTEDAKIPSEEFNMEGTDLKQNNFRIFKLACRSGNFNLIDWLLTLGEKAGMQFELIEMIQCLQESISEGELDLFIVCFNNFANEKEQKAQPTTVTVTVEGSTAESVAVTVTSDSPVKISIEEKEVSPQKISCSGLFTETEIEEFKMFSADSIRKQVITGIIKDVDAHIQKASETSTIGEDNYILKHGQDKYFEVIKMILEKHGYSNVTLNQGLVAKYIHIEW
jgi:hypothetical protein